MPDRDVFKNLAAYKPGKWFHAQTIDEMHAFYLSRLPAIRDAAKECGYAIGVHGSERRDFDLLAMPWTDEHSSIDDLAIKIQFAACGFKQARYEWEQKPAGRMATAMPICWTEWHDMISAGHIDLSVLLPSYQREPAEKIRSDLSNEYQMGRTAQNLTPSGIIEWVIGELTNRGILAVQQSR